MLTTAKWMALGALLATLGCATDHTKSFEYDEATAAQYAEAFCSCTPDGRPQEICQTQVNGALVANSVFAARAGRIEVHAEHWEECLDQVGDCRRETWPACEQFLIGQVEKGEPCVFVDECAEGLYCADPAVAAECTLGVCTATHERGEPCDGDDACSGDDRCFALEAGAERTCRAPVERGEPCPINFVVENHCVIGLHCVPDEDGQPVCGEPLELGEPCGFTLPDEVTDLTVNGGLYPNPCTNDAFCPEDELECTSADEQEFGDDEPLQALGEACDGEFGALSCDYGAVCVDEVCVERKSVGEPCEVSDECWGACVDRECAPEFEQCEGELT